MAIESPFEVISSEDLLAQITDFNNDIKKKLIEDPDYDWREIYVMLGTDVVSLFPSLSAEKTREAVRKQAEKTALKWDEIDEMCLSLYIRLNRDLCHDYEAIKHLLPVRRRERRGKEAGMGSTECNQRYLQYDDENSNWDWPNLPLREKEIRILMGRALEISIKFFFSNFAYTFGGDLLLQMFGGPIGARLTMCVARLVMQQWREEYTEILAEAGIKELLSKIYVDDNRAIMEIIKPGWRYVEKKKKFKFNENWIEDDKKVDRIERTMREVNRAMDSVNTDLKFTLEHESQFPNKRLPTLAFEIWSTKEGIKHSYFDKKMRSQILTMKKSSQSENFKVSILTNELNRRFQMMDDLISIEEKVEKIDQFSQQLINSGYQWS